MAGFTPGPWADLNEASYQNSGPCRGVSADVGSHRKSVAHVVGWDEPEAVANARLIAAAPDLYHAARLVLQRITKPNLSPDANVVVEKLEAAIRKVEGAEQ